jgi:cytoskeletal protein CcmA (bactofilin family)
MFSNKSKSNSEKPTDMDRNVIAKNSVFKGDISSEGDFRIDGVLEGTLQTKGRVIIGKEGKITGNVEATNADVEGKFSGELKVTNILTIKSSAHISGDVFVGKLSVEPGAIFNATCAMKGAAVKELNKNNDQKRLKETAS